jgi:hypothetical protein
MATIASDSVCTEIAGAVVRISDGINDAITFLDELGNMKDELVAYAEGLGQKCSVLGGLDSLLEEEDKFRKPFEDALAKIGEVASKVYEEYNNIMQQIINVYEEGIALLQAGITAINDAVNYAITKVTQAVDFITKALVDVSNAVTAALCDVLGPVISRLPGPIKAASQLLTAYAVAQIEKETNPQRIAKKLLDQLNLDSVLEELQEYMDPLNNLPELPDLSEYICDPSELPGATGP